MKLLPHQSAAEGIADDVGLGLALAPAPAPSPEGDHKGHPLGKKTLSRESLPSIIESILFVAEEPVEVASLCRALSRSKTDVQAALVSLDERHREGGIRLQRTGDQVQFVSAPENGPYVEQYLGIERRQRLSGAALESLAIIAYKQPVTRAVIEGVRGVNSDGAVASLIARGLIEEVGRVDAPGRPALFATTMKFLEHFGLKDPSDLPPLSVDEAVTGT